MSLSLQALLQLLVLTQEQERKHLLKFLHGVSLEDLQESEYRLPPKEGKSIFSSFTAPCLSGFLLYFHLSFLFPVSYADSQKQAALRNGCIKKLRQIHADLQTHNQTHACSELWSQHQLEDCSMVLLTELIELQELQASVVLPTIIDKVSQGSHCIQSEDSTIMHGLFYVSVRVHSMSKLCEMSMNLNLEHSAT